MRDLMPGLETPEALLAWARSQTQQLESEECVALAKLIVSAPGSVRGWRRGPGAFEQRLPIGTPVATFLDRDGNPSDLYDAGIGVGVSGNFTTHAGIVMDYPPHDGAFALRLLEIYPGSQGVRKRIYPADPALFGSKSGLNYCAILDAEGVPLGGSSNAFFADWMAMRT